MTAHVINLPRPGNGAREALDRIFGAEWGGDTPGDYIDTFLTELWCEGFKVVPLDKNDEDFSR